MLFVPLDFCSHSCWPLLLSSRLQLLLLLQERLTSNTFEGELAPSSWGRSWSSPPRLSTSTVLLSVSLRTPVISSWLGLGGSASETGSEGRLGVTDGGGEEGCAWLESSTALPPPEGDSGVVGGVLSTELLPLLGNSCSLSGSICSSEASSSAPASGSIFGSFKHDGMGGGGELAASVSESENSSLRVFLGHCAWMLDHTSFWPFERTAGLSSAFPVTLTLFSGISQNRACLLLFVFSFIPLYFLDPFVFGRLRSLSSACDPVSAVVSSSELLLSDAPRSSLEAEISSFLGEPPGNQSALLVFLVLALDWIFGVLSEEPSYFLFLVLTSPSASGWRWRFPTSELSAQTKSEIFGKPGGGLDPCGGVPLSQCSDGCTVSGGTILGLPLQPALSWSFFCLCSFSSSLSSVDISEAEANKTYKLSVSAAHQR